MEHMGLKKWFDGAPESVLRRSILKSPMVVHILFSDTIFCSKGSMYSIIKLFNRDGAGWVAINTANHDIFFIR